MALSLLLDTHMWIWSILEPERMPPAVRDLVESGEHDLWLSPISLWEVLLLEGRGKLYLGADPPGWIEHALRQYPTREAALNHQIAVESRRVPLDHQDPADRFLAATAIVLDLTLLTQDAELLRAPGVPTFDGV